MLIDNTEILPIAFKATLHEETLKQIKHFLSTYQLQPKYETTNYFGTFIVNNLQMAIYLKERRYDVMEEHSWISEFGKIIAAFENLGYKFYYEPQICN